MARRRDTAVRDGILRAATEAFGERGFQSTTIKTIADRQGISPGTVYVYFRSKEELFRLAVEDGWADFLSEIRRIVGTSDRLRDRFETILDYCFDSLQSALPLLRGMLFDSRRRHLLQENLDRLVDLLEGLAEEVGTATPGAGALDPGLRRFQIRITVLGVLTSVALVPDESLQQEVAGLKDLIKRLQYARFAPGGEA
jgi:AcrR family transcriptional regulator